ncbi:YadA-like family protein [Pseudocitrobacter faecalis]|uniref:YadA C-terminal domain-containing protein n=1 Tax=Pseudocitrobacter faecalis TaxID=1398493 RepID=UPI00389AE4B6
MNTIVKKSLLAIAIATVCAPALASIDEGAISELNAIQPGMSHAQVDQKINRFMIRTGSGEEATTYLEEHGFMNDDGDTIYPSETVSAPGHFVRPAHGSIKIEDEANANGNLLTRAIINRAEHIEGMNHNERYLATPLEAPTLTAEQMQVEENNIKRAAYAASHPGANVQMITDEVPAEPAAAPVVPGSPLGALNQKLGGVIASVQTGEDAAAEEKARIQAKFEALKGADRTKDNVTRTQSQVTALNAAHVQRFKELKATQGAALEEANRERVSVQHVDSVAVQARLTEQEQADRDSAQDVAITAAHDRANTAVTMAHDNRHFTEVVAGDVDTNTANIEGVQKEQANRDRTAQQRVTDTTAQTLQAEHDAAQDKSIATTSHNAVTALMHGAETSQRVTGLELEQMNRDRTAQQRVTAAPVKGDTGATGAAGKDGSNGKDGLNGKDGISITKVETDTATREAVSVNRGNIHTNTKAIAANRDGVNINRTAINKLATQQQIDSVTYGEQIHALATDTATAINSDRSAIRSNRSQIDSNSQQINKLNSNFSNLKSQVDANKHEAAAGASSAMAQANIPQVLNGQTVAIGAGVGGYDGENAVAVGVSFRASQNVTVKATVSDDTQQNVGYGAGVSIGW